MNSSDHSLGRGTALSFASGSEATAVERFDGPRVGRTAILLLGFQRDYFSEDGALYSVVADSVKSVVSNTVNLIRNLKAAKVDIDVIYLPIQFSDDYHELTDPVGIMKIIQDAGAFRRNSPGSNMIDELLEFRGSILQLEGKISFNAFDNTILEGVLLSREVTDVVLAGAVTSICVDSTGRAASAKGFRVAILEDCISGRTVAENEFFKEQIFGLYGETLLSNEFLDASLQSIATQWTPLAIHRSHSSVGCELSTVTDDCSESSKVVALVLFGFQEDSFCPPGLVYSSTDPAEASEALRKTKSLVQSLRSQSSSPLMIHLSFDLSWLTKTLGTSKKRGQLQGSTGKPSIETKGSGGETILDGLLEDFYELKCLNTFDAFSHTSQLHHILTQHGVTDLVMAGALPTLCIDCTARKAQDLGYRVLCVEDCSFSRTAMENHYFFRAVAPMFAQVVSSSRWRIAQGGLETGEVPGKGIGGGVNIPLDSFLGLDRAAMRYMAAAECLTEDKEQLTNKVLASPLTEDEEEETLSLPSSSASSKTLASFIAKLRRSWRGTGTRKVACNQDAASADPISLDEATRQLYAVQAQAQYRLVSTADELRKKTEELEDARSDQRDFLSYIMHEVRNPMSAICAAKENLRIALESDVELSPEKRLEVDEMLSAIDQAADVASGILDDTLCLHQIESGKLTLHKEVVDLWREVIDPSLRLFQMKAKAKSVELGMARSSDHGKGGLLTVNADRNRMMQVVINMLSNAIKFTPAGGRVSLKVDLSDPDSIALHVQDTGAGIHPDDIKKLFRSYTQVHTPGKRTEKGTGLGLAISQHIAKGHDGVLKVESTVGVGSTFTLVLPRIDSEVDTEVENTSSCSSDYSSPGQSEWRVQPPPPDILTPTSTPGAMALSNKNIALVEDNALVRKMTTRMLEIRWGARVVEFESCDAFMEACYGPSPAVDFTDFDFCLMDNVMPGLSGVEAVRAVRDLERRFGLAKLDIIMLTGTCLEDESNAFLESGADYVLTKPLKPVQFEKALKTCGKMISGGTL